MDKPISDPQNKADIQTQDMQSTTQPASVFARSLDAASSVGAYGMQQKQNIQDLTSKAWDESGHTPWASTPQGRLGIRLVSRGIIGAGFFAAGGFLAENWMKGYNYTTPLEQQNNPLQFTAKLIDNTFGRTIESATQLVTGSKELAESMVTFRPTKYSPSDGRSIAGRSLGSEVVNITFDFFSGSVGDAIGRDLVSLFDPNEKKPWVDENGRGNLLTLADNTVKAAWRYVTYNGGEDWAVAIPYAYFMKGQRALIDKWSPGFKYDFDRNANGGSFKIDKDRNIIGSFAREGMLDIQTRFTFYNIGTLMYRELYSHVGSLLQGKKSSLYGSPDAPGCENKSFAQSAGDVMKWGIRSAIKGTLYMTPAVPFFSISKTSQRRGKGVFVDQGKQKVLGYMADRPNILRAEEIKASNGESVFYGSYNEMVAPELRWSPSTKNRGSIALHGGYGDDFNVHQQSGDLFDRKVSGVGQLQHNLREYACDKLAGPLDSGLDYVFPKTGPLFGTHQKKTSSENELDPRVALKVQTPGFLKRATNAAISYTPYMMAKAELANLWDDGKMDLATERLIDGANSLNWGEFKAGASEVYHAILRKPLPQAEREVEAQHRKELDNSAPVSFTQTQAERRRIIEEAKKRREALEAKVEEKMVSKASDLTWQERTITAKESELANDSPKPDSRPRSFAQNEAMKKALQELKPPSSAIH
jgi:hypothetical protein